MRSACCVLTLLLSSALLAQGPEPGARVASSPAQDRPTLRVFLLAGQSNMEGHGVVDLDDARDYNGGRGTLARFLAEPANAQDFGDLLAQGGGFATRDDVFVRYLTAHGTVKAAALSVGFAVYDVRPADTPVDLGASAAEGLQAVMPGSPAVPTSCGVLMRRGATRPRWARSQVSTTSQTGLTPGCDRASSATGAQPATL